MHDVLLTFKHPSGADTQRHFAQTLRQYYLGSLLDCSSILPMLISYLSLRCHEHDARKADVLALCQVADGLPRFDFSDPTIEPLKALLIRAAIHPLFLRLTEGRRFIASLFTLDVPLIGELHAAIKAQLPNTRASLLDHYGDVYWRAWKLLSTSPQAQHKMKLEIGCIQDMMALALNVSNEKTSQALRKVLHVIHSKRRQHHVDQLIARLWEPLLWRALNAANPVLRRHALAVLIDVFPVASLNDSVPQEAFITQQLATLIKALSETHVQTRALAVTGLCSVLDAYWELLPAAATIDILAQLLDRAFDVGAATVRVAVIKGVIRLIANHITHPLLMRLLPTLAPLIDDRNDGVQCALVQLLQTLKSLRDVKYYHVVPVDALLATLGRSTNKQLSIRISELIVNSFVPVNATCDAAVGRMMMFIERNASAAQVFYAHLHEITDLQTCLRIIYGLMRALNRSCSDSSSRGEQAVDAEDKENSHPGKGKGRRNHKKQKSNESLSDEQKNDADNAKTNKNKNKEPIDAFRLDLNDRNGIEHALAILNSMWTAMPRRSIEELDEFTQLVDSLKTNNRF